MSICPDDALHHLFVDDEIPSEHLSAYIQHADACPDCQKKIRRIKALRNRLRSDSSGGAFSDPDVLCGELEEDFDRLMTKMKFRTVSRVIRQNETRCVIRRTLPWVAAVVVMISGASMFLRGPGNAGIQTARQNDASAVDETGRQIAIPKQAFDENAGAAPVLYNSQTAGTMMAAGFEQQGASLPYIPDVDVFRPSFVYSQGGNRIIISGIITFTLENPSADPSAARQSGD